MGWSFKKYKRCMTDVSSVKEEEKDNVQLDATSGGSRKGSLTHVCGCSRSHNTDKNIFITEKTSVSINLLALCTLESPRNCFFQIRYVTHYVRLNTT